MKKLIVVFGLAVIATSCKKEIPLTKMDTTEVSNLKSNSSTRKYTFTIDDDGEACCILPARNCLEEVIVTPAGAADLAFNGLQVAIANGDHNAIRTLLTTAPLNTIFESSDINGYLSGGLSLFYDYSTSRRTSYFGFRSNSSSAIISVYPVKRG